MAVHVYRFDDLDELATNLHEGLVALSAVPLDDLLTCIISLVVWQDVNYLARKTGDQWRDSFNNISNDFHWFLELDYPEVYGLATSREIESEFRQMLDIVTLDQDAAYIVRKVNWPDVRYCSPNLLVARLSP